MCNNDVIKAYNLLAKHCKETNDCENCILWDRHCQICATENLMPMCENCHVVHKNVQEYKDTFLCEYCQGKQKIRQDIQHIFDTIESVTSPSCQSQFKEKIVNYIYENYDEKNER